MTSHIYEKNLPGTGKGILEELHMSLKENARFAFGLKYVRAFALNPDFHKPTLA